MTQAQKIKALHILNHYDSKKQLLKCCEELSELETALLKHINKGNHHGDVLTETADVYIMLEQMVQIMPFGENVLEDEIEAKLNRQLGRIRGEE